MSTGCKIGIAALATHAPLVVNPHASQRNLASALKLNTQLSLETLTGVPVAEFWSEAGLPFPVVGPDAGRKWRTSALLRNPGTLHAQASARRALRVLQAELGQLDHSDGDAANRALLAAVIAYQQAMDVDGGHGGRGSGDSGWHGRVRAGGGGRGGAGSRVRQVSVPLLRASNPGPAMELVTSQSSLLDRSSRVVSYGVG